MTATRYELGERLGEGGAGEVFAAVARDADGTVRRVALKRLAPLSGPGVDVREEASRLTAFREEARLLARLAHRGIVAILDHGISGGAPFLVLELVDGMSAGSALRKARARGARGAPVVVALAIVAEVARALEHAHRAAGADGRPLGLVHRDVKPANVLLSWDGDVKLGDFGIARADDRVAQTTTGFVKGTPGYMAPEQLLGSPIDARADVFALGVTTLTLLVGSNPLADRAVATRLVAGVPLPLPEALDADVRALVARALAPRREDRHESALAFAEEAAAALARRPGRGPRAEIAAWLATLVAARPVRAAVVAPTLLARVGATDTFVEPRAAPPPRPRARRLGTFGGALGGTVLLGAVGLALAARVSPRSPASPGPSASSLAAVPVPEALPAADAAVTAVSDAEALPVARVAPPPRGTASVARPAPTTSSAAPRVVRKNCLCVKRAADGEPTSICRALGPSLCVCWVPSLASRPNARVACLTPFASFGDCKGAQTRGVTDQPCQGYARPGDTTPSAGTLGCGRCVDWGDGVPGDPCEGVVEETGERLSGKVESCD